MNITNSTAAEIQHIISAAGVAQTMPYIGNNAFNANISGMSSIPLRRRASISDFVICPVAWKNDITVVDNTSMIADALGATCCHNMHIDMTDTDTALGKPLPHFIHPDDEKALEALRMVPIFSTFAKKFNEIF